jgi:hypothetical protein
MTYAIIDRKHGKILEVAGNKKSLSGIVVARLDQLGSVLNDNEIKSLYRHETGHNRAKKNTDAMVKEIAQSALKHTAETHNVDSIGKVAHARIIFEDMKGLPRKEVLSACTGAGINVNTAKTQYHRWKNEK